MVAALVFILVVTSSVNLWLVAHDDRPPWWDYAYYLSSSLNIYNAIGRGSFSQLFAAISDPYRPPLVPLAALPFYAAFGTGYRSAMLVTVLFLAILTVSTYKLGKIIHSCGLGLVAAGVVSTLPGVMTYTRVFNIDFPTMALVPAGMYFAVASEGFRKRGMSLALGAVIGLGLLTKWSYIVFLAPMIIAESIHHRRNLGSANMILSGLVAAATASAWYVNALRHGLIQSLIHYAYGAAAKPYVQGLGSMFDLSTLLFYPFALYERLMGPFYFVTLFSAVILASIVGAVFLRGWLKSLVSSRLTRSLAFSFLAPLMIFTFLELKSVRYFLPALPSLVILLLAIVWNTHARLGPLLLVGILVGGSLVSVVGALEPTIGARWGIYDSWTIYDTIPHYYSEYQPPKSDDWKLEQMIQLVARLNPQANIGTLADHWVFNQDTLTYYAVRLGFDTLRFRDFRDSQIYPPYDDLNYYDFILLKTGIIGFDWDTQTVRGILQRLNSSDDAFYVDHNMVGSFSLPDDSQLFVFMKIVSSSVAQAPQHSPLSFCVPTCLEISCMTGFEPQRYASLARLRAAKEAPRAEKCLQ